MELINSRYTREKLVIHTARAYADIKMKRSAIGNVANEGTRIQDILW